MVGTEPEVVDKLPTWLTKWSTSYRRGRRGQNVVDVVDAALPVAGVYLHVVGAEFGAPKMTLHLETNSIL